MPYNWVEGSLILVGAAIMLAAFVRALRLRAAASIVGASGLWNAIAALTLVFLGGYVAALGLILAGERELLEALAAAIFLGGAVYVFLTVKLAIRLTADLQRTSEEARRAGVAEVTTGVLHNVGNVLNSIAVAATSIAQNARRSTASRIPEATGILLEHRGSLDRFLSEDVKGRKLLDYLNAAADEVARNQAAALEEVARLSSFVEHARQIIALQHDIATAAPFSESLVIQDVLEDAIRLSAASMEKHHIEVVRDWGDPVRLIGDRHRLLQILVNLVSNAKHAVIRSGRPDKRVVLAVREVGQPDGKNVEIRVTDNGVGIAPEDARKIFQYGFTTKPKGHGFGLHSSEAAARVLRGTLTFSSEGVGKGATFVLRVPMPVEATAVESRAA